MATKATTTNNIKMTVQSSATAILIGAVMLCIIGLAMFFKIANILDKVVSEEQETLQVEINLPEYGKK